MQGNDFCINEYRGCCNSTFLRGCPQSSCESAVCAVESRCCTISWNSVCVDLAANLCQELCTSKDDNSYHVVTGSGTDATTVLDGMTITNGLADDVLGTPNWRGGGLYIIDGSPTISHCRVWGNDAGLGGGGLYLDGGDPMITDCVFANNRASSYSPEGSGDGGAMNLSHGNPDVIRCSVTGNWAGIGGGIKCTAVTTTIRECTISGNIGEGLVVQGQGDVVIERCLFTNNFGRGIALATRDPILRDSIIIGNRGGGIRCEGGNTVDIANCLLAGNSTSTGRRQDFI